METDALESATRRRIHDFVEANPGTHLRETARLLGLPLGTALYHLDVLLERGHLVVRQDGRYKRFFLRDAMGRREKDYVTVLRHAVPRRIARALLAAPGRTQRELCGAIGVSRSTLSFHLGQMVGQGVVACEDRRPEKLYAVAEPALAMRLLREFGESFSAHRVTPSTPTGPAPSIA